MKLCGLVRKSDDFFVPDIFDCYKRGKRPKSPEWLRAFRKVSTVRQCPPIEFIGVWDTVGALGAPGWLGRLVNRNKYEYHDVGLNDCIGHAVQALSIDERRGPFIPNIWSRPEGWKNRLEQAWFPGAHCGVGGGYKPDGLANEALHWVLEKAESHGLMLDSDYLAHYAPVFHSTLFDSMSLKYRLFRPHTRAIGQQSNTDEFIHQAALDRLNHSQSEYKPENLNTALGLMPPLPIANTCRIPRGWPS